MAKGKILVVDDEEHILELIRYNLDAAGYDVIEASDGDDAVKNAINEVPDLILLDLMLPELDGFEVARRLRKEKDTPIIMMTARDSTMDRVAGLDIGADDYITKPFAIEELLARVRAFFRREEHGHAVERAENTSFRDLVIDKTNRTVHRGKKVIDLTRREYDLLLTLMQNVGDVVTREYLVSQVWGYEEGTETNVVDVYIRYLRNKIDVEGQDSYIQTVRGLGYVMRERK